MKGALASNWVVETATSTAGGFTLQGSAKGYTTFDRSFNNGDKVFYAAHDEQGNREAGWAEVSGRSLINRNPTATLLNDIYAEGDALPEVSFSGPVTIACTFNAVAFDTIWDHVFREDNPHNVTAPQVDLDPVLLPLGPDDQNVQAALEFLYSYFTENGGGDWHLTHIDGNYVYIEIKHGPRSEFPPTIVDLDLAELKINHDDGQLWTRLADDTIVKIGDKDLVTEAPLDGELYGRKVSDTDPTVGDWFRISLATVSDDMPDNPAEGDLWVDTKSTMELYVYVDGQGWISMTGAGSGGGLADNITTDDVDGTLHNVLLGREVLDDETARWRPIYSSDVVPADGANPMTAADGSILRNQADINKFLYAETQNNTGGGGGASSDSWHDLIDGLTLLSDGNRPTGGADPGEVTIWHLDPDDATTAPEQEFKVYWADAKDLIDKFAEDDIHFGLKLVQGDLEMTMSANDAGWTTGGTTWHVSCKDVKGDVLVAGDPVVMQILYDVPEATSDWVSDNYVNKAGDEMTGPLDVDDVVRANHLKSTKMDSGEDTNLSLQRKGDTKLLITSKDTLAYQPVKYNAEYTLDHDRHLINKGYVDDLVEETVENADLAYVQKHKDGGDSMEGPLTISNQPGVDSRQSRRLNALNVFSNTSSSSLQLGTTNTKIYVGHNDTSFNTPIKLNEIQDRGAGVTFTGTIKFADQDVLMDIAPAAGTTQHIKLFEGVGTSDDHTTLKVDINGATFKKAIEFESGPSSGKEIIFRLDSNRGVRARNLNMDDTNITKLADPVNPDHAVNLKTVDGLIGNLEDRLTDRLDTLITDNSSGEMKYVVKQMPTVAGEFMCLTTNGAQTTYDPTQTREIWAHNTNLSGYDFRWSEVKPNMYFYMAGPDDSLARFRVVADPQDQGTWTKIKVNDPEIYPNDKKWVVNDTWDILFRTFTGESTDLDDYVKKTGDTMTGPLEAQLHTDYIKFSGDSKRIVEGGSVRMEFDNRVIIDKGTTVPGGGFELKGRTSEGTNHKLLQVYHNNTGGTDAVNYYGKQEGDTNLATVGYVKSIVGGDSDISGDTPFTPYGPLRCVPPGQIPAAGEISFGSATPNETTSIALNTTDANGKVWDYKFNEDSIFTVSIVDKIGDDTFRQTISIRVDGVENKGSWVVLTVDGRDLSSKQRDESTGQYYYVALPQLWYINNGAEATPLQKVPVTFDELFQFRDETSIFPAYLHYRLSTSSGDGFQGAGRGWLYMENSLTNPNNIRLGTRDKYGYGYLGKAAKTSATAFVNVPGEMTMFARSLWSKQIIPVEGYYFDGLYFNHSKNSMRLQSWGKSWDDDTHHTWKEDEEVFVKFDFAPKAHSTSRMEEQIAELTARLAKLEGAE